MNIGYDLTIGMIVKNEEKYIEKCLKALLPLKEKIKCELIVTDTGSTDTTVEIAERYADKVLQFEWCDDFSKARNTGVEVSKGSWFMFVDADEIFDESINQIVAFIMSKDRDKYDCATYIQRNYVSKNSKKFNDFEAQRLYNFTNGKKYFNGIIHECIDAGYNVYSTKAVVKHYGYVSSVIPEKNLRNRLLLEKELEGNPKNIRTLKHLFDVVDFDYQEEVAQKAFDIIQNGRKNNYKDIQSPYYVFILYCEIVKSYLNNGDNDLAVKYAEEYLEHTMVKSFISNDILPTLEIYFLYAKVLFNIDKYVESYENFIKYQNMYYTLKQAPDNVFCSTCFFSSNTDSSYQESKKIILELHFKSNDFGEFDYINEGVDYVLKTIQYDNIHMFDKIDKHYKNDPSQYSDRVVRFIGIAKIYFYKDIIYFVENYQKEDIDKILIEALQNIGKLSNVVYEILHNDIEVDSLEEFKTYIKIAYCYLMSQSFRLEKNNETTDFKRKVEDIFVFFVESNVYYLNQIHKAGILQPNLDVFSKEEQVCVLISESFENRYNDNVSYIKALKKALISNEKFKYVILNSIDLIDNTKIEHEVIGNEFDDLSQKIKQTISTLIENKELDQAKALIEQYKSINPNDYDIEKFEKLSV